MIRSVHFLSICLLFAGLTVIWSCGNKEASVPANAVDEHAGHDHAATGGAHSETAPPKSVLSIDWCAEHSVPESKCTKCNPSLIDGFKASGDWCGGHGLPESQCRLCNPGITFPEEALFRGKQAESSKTDISVSLYFRPNAVNCATDSALIQFATAQTAERAGIVCQTVRSAQFDNIIEAPAEIVFDEGEATVVSSTVSALVTRWMVSPGDRVRAGDILAYMTSSEIGELKSGLLTAHSTAELERVELSRRKELLERTLISNSEFDRQAALVAQSEAELGRWRSMLLSAGLAEADIDESLKHKNLMNQFALRSPSDGMIVDRKAKLGELLPAGNAYAIIANPNAMWIEGRMTEENIAKVLLGQQVTFSSDGGGLNQVGGEIVWVSKFLDPHSRTGTVRARVFTSPEGLRSGELGRILVHQRDKQEVVLVPRDAVQWEGCCNVVFVRESAERYRPRKVQLLDGDGPMYQVVSGAHAGEDVVVSGAFLLKTELKKSSIGAGCCEVEPIG
jgi:membrane fusion protein, heavy metal efflux system